MYRLKIWGIGYFPMLVGILVAVYLGLNIGQFIMALSLITIPIALKMEQSILQDKGLDYSNGSPIGNVIAKVLGAIFVCCALWLFGYMLVNIIGV